MSSQTIELDLRILNPFRCICAFRYLQWESYAAAVEAMLWWQERPRYESRRFITMVNQQLRGMRHVEQDRAAA